MKFNLYVNGDLYETVESSSAKQAVHNYLCMSRNSGETVQAIELDDDGMEALGGQRYIEKVHLFSVLDGIIDDREYTDEILSDISAIEQYAENCGINISFDDAEKIQLVGKQWLIDIESGEWVAARHAAMRAFTV